MKKIKTIVCILFVPVFCICLNSKVFAKTKTKQMDFEYLRPANPDNDESKNTEKIETEVVPNQYQGKMKKKKHKEKFRFTDARFYGGFGMRYSLPDEERLKTSKTDAQIQAETGQSSTIYYDENIIDFDGDSGFFASLGLYWSNGIRIELEYSQSKYEEKDLSGFYFYETSQGNNIWEYMGSDNAVYVNSQPIAKLEYDVKTAMVNFIYEFYFDKIKLTPYIGVGGGAVFSDLEGLPNDGSANAFAGQGMAGLGYRFGRSATLYLGYRYIQSGTLDQKFTRVVQVSYSAPNYTAYTIESEEEYDYVAHCVDLGIRFFF